LLGLQAERKDASQTRMRYHCHDGLHDLEDGLTVQVEHGMLCAAAHDLLLRKCAALQLKLPCVAASTLLLQKEEHSSNETMCRQIELHGLLV